jgi:hypothetical protein
MLLVVAAIFCLVLFFSYTPLKQGLLFIMPQEIGVSRTRTVLRQVIMFTFVAVLYPSGPRPMVPRFLKRSRQVCLHSSSLHPG